MTTATERTAGRCRTGIIDQFMAVMATALDLIFSYGAPNELIQATDFYGSKPLKS
jgi:hypothetical protein